MIRICSTALLLATLTALAPMRAAQAVDVRTADDYPCWQGRYGSAGAESGYQLIRDWKNARLVWQTPANLPIGYEPHWERNGYPRGGYSSPVVADGRVFLYYYEGTGTVQGSGGYFNRYRRSPCKTAALIDANDIVHCFDARTGKTLWKRVFENRGVNIPGNGTHHTPCVFDGRVYAVGTIGDVYCLDAETGKSVWETDLGGYTESWRIYKNWCLENETGPSCKAGANVKRFFDKKNIDLEKYRPTPPRPKGSPAGGAINCCCTYAAGVLVTTDGWRGVIGFDGRTGRRLWHHSNVRQGCTSPIRWVHGGREYVVCRTDKVTAIEPRSGKIMWQVKADQRYTSGSPVVDENHLVVRGEDGVTCFRISPQGARKMWYLDDRTLCTSWTSMCISRGYVHYEVQLRNIHRWKNLPEQVKREAVSNGKKWSGLVSIELATGEVHRTLSGRDWNVSSIAGDGRIFTEKGIWDVTDPTNARYISDNKPFFSSRAGGWIAPAYAAGRLYFRAFDRKKGRHKLVCVELRTNPQQARATR